MANKPNVKLAAVVGASLPPLSDKDAEYWLNHPEQLAAALKSALTSLPQPAHPVYSVTADYGKTVLDRFQPTGTGKKPVEVTMLEFDRYISSEDAIKEMDRLGYRPATAQELDPLEHLDGLPDGLYIALGSTWRYPDGDLRVLCLDRGGSFRHLYLGWWDGGWRSLWRFAAVRK